MLFSIVTPTFNRSRLVRESIASYLGFIRACGVPAELIIVDDASTDDTLAAVARDFVPDLASSILKLIPLTKNAGWTHARNVGIREAQGQWVLFTDSDDLLELTAAPAFVKLLQNNLDKAVIFTRCISRTMGTLIGPLHVAEMPVPMPPLLGDGTPAGECLAAVRRDVIRAIPFEPNFQGFENITYAKQMRAFGPGLLSPLAVRIYGDEATGDRLSLLPARIRRARSMVYGNLELIKNFWHLLSLRKQIKMLLRIAFYLPFYWLGLLRLSARKV